MIPRLVLVLNETAPRAQPDWYLALDRLVAEGRLQASAVVPHAALRAQGATSHDVLARVLDEARHIEARLVLWAHTGDLRLSAEGLAHLRDLASGMAMGFWDGDWYHRYKVPFPRACRDLCARVDVAFVCGDGWLVSHLHRHGCRDVRYVANSTDERFPLLPPPAACDFDLVMVGNRTTSRLPFKDMPGAILRRRLVRYFERRLGRRFAVFGYGWTGPSAQGRIPYERQGEAYAAAFASLGCSSWLNPYNFSDRLPIMMSSGRPAIHYAGPGYEEVFGRDPGVFWFRTLEQAWQRFRTVADDPEAAQRAARRAHELALTRFTTYDTLVYMVAVLKAHGEARASGRPVTPVANPWIRRERL